MSDLWATLVPLIIGSALVPVQIIITILLLRSTAGRLTAVAWVLGMTMTRLAQGAVFALLLSSTDLATGDAADDRILLSTLLLVVAILLIGTAVRTLVIDEDPDAPPPKWLTKTESMQPGKALLLGMGVLAIGPKFWVFTLGALAAIGDADLGQPAAGVTYLAFVVLASSINLAIVLVAFALPHRSAALLTGTGEWLTHNNRLIVIVMGFVFGGWFLVQALDGLGVI